MTILIILFAPGAGKLSDRVGARWLIGGGLSLVAVSLVLFAQLDPATRPSGISSRPWSSAASAWV